MERIIEARALAQTLYADLWPSFFLNFDTLNSGSLSPFGNVNPLSNIGTACPGLAALCPNLVGAENPLRRFHLQQYTLAVTGTYEVDLFGRIRNGYYAAEANADAIAYAYEGVSLSLTADVALNYFSVRSLDAQIEVLRRTILSRQEAFDINSSRFEAGLVNYSDVTRAANQLTTAKADLAQIELLRARAENVLATLLGQIPSVYCFPYMPLRKPAPSVCPILPSELIARRPDIAQAERELAAQNYLIGVARSEFFPSFSLTGSLGFRSPDIEHLFDWRARFWSWATQTSQLLFNAGKTEARVQAALARFYQSLGNYEQLVLNAFAEVESALAAERLTRETYRNLASSVSSAQETRTISHERYLQGLVTYLDVTDAEQNLLIDALRFAQSRLETYRSTIELIRSIGGGFDRCQTILD
jgi:multidrug efflux system outer membrane protein